VNKLILIFFVWSGLSVGSQFNDFVDIPSDGLVAYYSFNDCEAFDQSGKQSHGKIMGKGTCRCGVEGNGIMLNGRTDYIEFGGQVNKYFTTSDFSLSFYFKPTSPSIFKQSLVSKRVNCDEFHALDIILDQTNDMMITEFIQEDYIRFSDMNAPVKSGEWNHYALVRKGTRAYTYINGRLMNEARRCSGVDIDNEAKLSIGNSPCVGSGLRRFEGIVDELRVYEKPLSHQEVMDLYRRMLVEDAEKGCVS
jgi:hypothetical protein